MCPFQTAFNALKRFAGLPVPVTVTWFDGKPDFRIMNPAVVNDCVTRKRCAVCGDKLGVNAYWIGGPKCLESNLFTDAAMHRGCAMSSMQLCPFLTGKREQHRTANLPPNVRTARIVDSKRPDTMYLMVGKTKKMRIVQLNGATLIHSGKLDVVTTF